MDEQLNQRLLFAAPLAALAAAAAWWVTRPRPPEHMVLIVLDTLRADRLGVYGFDQDTSPELDAIAAEGLFFVDVVAQAPWTRPSIGSLLTSKYPRSLGLYDEKDEALPESADTLAELLAAADFRTIGATANPNLNRLFRFEQGYDVYFESTSVWGWMEPEEGQQVARDAGVASAPELFDQVFGALDEETAEQAAQRHFLFFDLMEVHEHGRKGIVRPEFRMDFRTQRDGAYLRRVRQLSSDVGAFVAQLRERPGWEDTLFVLVSDHGEGLSSHGRLRKSETHGYWVYGSQTHVPWIVMRTGGNWPRGRMLEPRVRLLDLAPTMLDLLGADVPESMEGVSLADLVRDPDAQAPVLPERFVVETRFRGRDKIAVYGQDYVYIDNRDEEPRVPPHELQRRHVPERGQQTDVGAQHPAERRALREYLEQWEAARPEAPPTPLASGITETEAEQLRQLGYIE